MGSEGPSSPVTTVHITGFKKFHGVAENPTEKIVRNLPSFMETKGLPKGLVLGSCTVLEAAGQGALGPLYELLESTVSGRECGMPSQERVILRMPIISSDGSILHSRQVLSSETVVDGEVKIEDMPCRETAGVRGRADVRLRSRDRIAGWPAVVADTWDIDKCKDAWSDRVD